ncbi:unnamed protein product, partial [Polarella glacialis]
ALNLAYETLRDSARREPYDTVWLKAKEEALPAHQRSDIFRRRGNELYSKAKELTKGAFSILAVQESVKLYQAAMTNYGKAVDLMPHDHRLFSNRALCYFAVEDWGRCREDAARCTRLRPDFMKGWYLLVKALWQMGSKDEALQELINGLATIPGCRDLLDLQASLAGSKESGSMYAASRSVSPVVTPSVSRAPTPPPGTSTLPYMAVRRPAASSRSPGPGQRPVSPALLAAGSDVGGSRSGRSPGRPGGHTFGGSPHKSSSRSPNAAVSRLPCPPSRNSPFCLDGSLSCPRGTLDRLLQTSQVVLPWADWRPAFRPLRQPCGLQVLRWGLAAVQRLGAHTHLDRPGGLGRASTWPVPLATGAAALTRTKASRRPSADLRRRAAA